MIMTSRTKTIHIIGASFAGQAFVDKYQSINPDCQLIVIDKEKAPSYIPNGLNQLLRGDIGNLSEAMWQSPYQDRLLNINLLRQKSWQSGRLQIS